MEQAVLVHIPLDDDKFGSEAKRESLYALEDKLTEAVEAAEVGEFDGNDFGGGECIFYMYGEDADALYDAVNGILKKAAVAKDGHAIKRYGPATDPASKEVRVTWGR
jgi:hypothetical protein